MAEQSPCSSSSGSSSNGSGACAPDREEAWSDREEAAPEVKLALHGCGKGCDGRDGARRSSSSSSSSVPSHRRSLVVTAPTPIAPAAARAPGGTVGRRQVPGRGKHAEALAAAATTTAAAPPRPPDGRRGRRAAAAARARPRRSAAAAKEPARRARRLEGRLRRRGSGAGARRVQPGRCCGCGLELACVPRAPRSRLDEARQHLSREHRAELHLDAVERRHKRRGRGRRRRWRREWPATAAAEGHEREAPLDALGWRGRHRDRSGLGLSGELEQVRLAGAQLHLADHARAAVDVGLALRAELRHSNAEG